LLARRSLYADRRRQFLLLWLLFGLAFFSLFQNKLPGYLLPMMPAAAVLMGTSFAESKSARWALPAAALCLVSIPLALPLLPQALAGGLSRAPRPSLDWTWLVPVILTASIYWLERQGDRGAAMVTMAVALTAGVLVLKNIDLPIIDRAASARPLWRQISGERDRVCVEKMRRNWRYGLNYYSVMPLPDCSQSPRPLHVVQTPGRPPWIEPR
jgi:4-amino-4-deoxy-L-arabinose transferase-like glycosyltransferase